MTKLIVSSLVIVATLCAPALADPAPTQPAQAAPVRLKFTVKIGSTVRTHDILIAEDHCGEIEEKTPDYSDEIRSCITSQSGAEIRLQIEWKTHESSSQFKTTSTALITRGKTFELGGGVARLSIAAT